MKTIALRFGETFSPPCGTIAAHQKIIDTVGFVWYGKLGASVSSRIIAEMKKCDDPKFLLIRSGKFERYWVHFNEVSYTKPSETEYPLYYGEIAEKMKTWFKVTTIELAPKDVMSYCYVVSSGKPLTLVSSQSLSPYFIIDYRDGEHAILQHRRGNK